MASPQRYLFTPSDMHVLVEDISDDAYRALLSRAAKAGKLERVCRGLYVYHPAKPVQGLMLFHAAARLRAHELLELRHRLPFMASIYCASHS